MCVRAKTHTLKEGWGSSGRRRTLLNYALACVVVEVIWLKFLLFELGCPILI